LDTSGRQSRRKNQPLRHEDAILYGVRAILLSLAVSGCSVAFVNGPPANHRQMPAFSCTEMRIAPILDLVFAGVEGINLGGALAVSDDRWNSTFNNSPPFSRQTAIAVYSTIIGLALLDLYYGYTRTAECREARAELAARTPATPAGVPLGIGTWPPPPITPPVIPAPLGGPD
jgi:hypothetical protein